MRRGDLYWATLGAPTGSGPGFRRPVVVIQANAFNDSRISTVIVAVVTSNLALSDAPGNIRLSRSDSGLMKPSVINVSQLLTIDRSLLIDLIRALPAAVVRDLDAGLRLALAL